MNQIMNTNPKEVQMKYIAGELQGLRMVISHLMGEDEKYRVPAFNAIYFIKSNYKQWPDMIRWMKANKLVGQKLVEFFQNESPDGGGYHMGAIHIVNRLEARKLNERDILITELI